ncbi:DUF6660 family protein [Mesonia ostreae]|uniref:Uncharacterized protein n=1 Tax=Mesonia ostreae TaxID=861110 RepID=A0ABU2KJP1_9FLAO|nr:DUF6660 family protein [Mesonia ostreae]MDT0294931.1 hypothetical protein [Mesonia ostreae]
MRVIALIFSIYILGINFVPCNDVAQENLSNDLVENVANTEQHSHSHDNFLDLCSPFCQCHCCHIHVIKYQVTNFETLHNEASTQKFAHIDNSGKDITNPLLQPPRV